jgi:hypothetical protein
MHEFELSLHASAARVFAALGDLAQWPAAEHPRMLVRKEATRVALSFDDATRVTISIEAVSADLCTLAVLHDLCQTQEQLSYWQNYWDARQAELVARFGA